MKLFDPMNYTNLLERINLTSQAVRQQIMNYGLSFMSVRNNMVEWGMQIPMFVPSFYDYVVKYSKIPAQEEFYSYYLLFNKCFFEQACFNREIMTGIKARCYRTYPSLVRDIYFNKYVSERLGSSYKVVYNIDLDMKEGIDMMIVDAAGSYKAINLYTSTARAYQGRAKKEYRHVKFDNVSYVEFPVEFQGSEKIGDFFMYGEKEFKSLMKYL